MSTETAPVEEQQAPQSMHDQLSEAFDDLAENESESEEHFETDNEIDDVVLESEDEPEEDVSTEEEPEEETVEASEEVEEDFNESPPERWPEDIKAAYNALTPAAKKAMLDQIYRPMQRSFTEKTQELAAQRNALKPMLETMAKHQQEFESAGVNPTEAFNRQMAWSAHFAKVGPEQGAKDLAKAYGQAGGQQDDAETAYLTPVERQQQARIEQMEQQLQGMTAAERQAREQAQSQQAEQRTGQVRSSIQQFASEMRDGQPTHPHVEKVSVQMAGLIRGGLVDRTDIYGQPVPYDQQLGQAYKMACEMDPSIRGAKETKTRKQQVARASAANREVVSKAPGHDVVTDNRKLSDSISDLYDRLDRSV